MNMPIGRANDVTAGPPANTRSEKLSDLMGLSLTPATRNSPEAERAGAVTPVVFTVTIEQKDGARLKAAAGDASGVDHVAGGEALQRGNGVGDKSGMRGGPVPGVERYQRGKGRHERLLYRNGRERSGGFFQRC